MTINVEIICHLGAGQGRGQKILNKVCNYLDQKSATYQIYPSQSKIELKQVIKNLIKNHQDQVFPLLVIGGDGSLHNVVENLYLNGAKIPVTYIPAGTGNDFARAWLKKTSYQESLDKMLAGKECTQVPIFTYKDLNKPKQGIILNSLGLGFDALTNKKKEDLVHNLPTWLAKLVTLLKLSYLFGLFLSLKDIPKFSIQIKVDQETIKIDQASIATLVNNPYMGGGIVIDNLSIASKEELAIIIYHHIGLSDVFELISRVLFFKNQDQSKRVSRYVGQHMEIMVNKPIQGQVDGESFLDQQTHLSITKSHYPFIL